MTDQPAASATTLRGYAIVSVLKALDVRDELARLGALVVLLVEQSIAAGNAPNFSKPVLMTWTTLAGDTMGIRIQVENELLAPGTERVQ